MSEPINVLLPELIVRPRGSYITYTGKETNRPSVADFIKAKAKEARVEAANKILKQYEPDVPTVTRSITPFNGLAGLVMSEKTRRDLIQSKGPVPSDWRNGVYPRKFKKVS